MVELVSFCAICGEELTSNNESTMFCGVCDTPVHRYEEITLIIDHDRGTKRLELPEIMV